MAHTCRGTISLHGAYIQAEDKYCNFIVSNGGGTQTFHLKTSSKEDRKHWIAALKEAKAKAIQGMESSEDEGEVMATGTSDAAVKLDFDKAELTKVVKTIGSKLADLQTCHELIVKHSLALQKSLNEMDGKSGGSKNDTSVKIKTIIERASVFKITASAMINASTEFLELCQVNCHIKQ